MADASAMQFSSMPVHRQSGLSMYPFRAYDPSLQRWLSRDPIGESGGINLYGFVGNNPANYVDPYGESWFGDLLYQAGQGIYDLMMGDRPGSYDPNMKGSIEAAMGMGIDRNDNVLRDSIGQGFATLGEMGKAAAESYMGGKLAEAGLGVAAAGVCKAKPLLRAAKSATQLEFQFAPQVEQYALRAAESGFYPVMVRGSENPQFITYLEKGDVWKFGTTVRPSARYSPTELKNIGEHGVEYSTEFLGTKGQAIQLQNMKIENYRFQNGRLPPGNKIIN